MGALWLAAALALHRVSQLHLAVPDDLVGGASVRVPRGNDGRLRDPLARDRRRATLHCAGSAPRRRLGGRLSRAACDRPPRHGCARGAFRRPGPHGVLGNTAAPVRPPTSALARGGASGPGPAALGQALLFSMPAYLGNLLQFLNYRLDVFFVAQFRPMEELGCYTLAVSLAQLIWVLSSARPLSLCPRSPKQSRTRGDGFAAPPGSFARCSRPASCAPRAWLSARLSWCRSCTGRASCRRSCSCASCYPVSRCSWPPTSLPPTWLAADGRDSTCSPRRADSASHLLSTSS